MNDLLWGDQSVLSARVTICQGKEEVNQFLKITHQGGDGGGVVEDIFVVLLYSMEKVQRVRCKILEEQCFQCEHPEGTL